MATRLALSDRRSPRPRRSAARWERALGAGANDRTGSVAGHDPVKTLNAPVPSWSALPWARADATVPIAPWTVRGAPALLARSAWGDDRGEAVADGAFRARRGLRGQ